MKEKCGKKLKLGDILNISHHLSTLFGSHGRLIARYPARYILACLLMVIGFGSGVYFLQWETNIVRLWNPDNSESGINFKWLWSNHPPDLRKHSILFKAENMLAKENIKKMAHIRGDLLSVVTPSGYSWNDVCLKVPYLPDNLKQDDSSDYDDPFGDDSTDPWDDDDSFHGDTDPLRDLYPKFLCPIFNELKTLCLEDSILELFSKNGTINVKDIDQLSNQEILNIINIRNISEMFSVAKDFDSMLGDITYNETGHIISAGVASLTIYGKMNVSESDLKKEKKDMLGSQFEIEQLDEATDEVEESFINFLGKLRAEELKLDKHQHNSSSYGEMTSGNFRNQSQIDYNSILLEWNVAKSLQDDVNGSILDDVPKCLGSFLIMFLYVSLSLGKLDCFENRVYVAWAGLVSILFALVASYGLCSYFGLVVSPLHNFIPFLLLGLGVDDMFVIVQALDDRNKEKHEDCLTEEQNVNKSEHKGTVKKPKIEDKIADVMSHSGVSITITSLTDFIAFAIGGTTAIPALKSFCIFCGIGIMLVYIFQATWFVAWLVVDERRKQSKRNAFLPCVLYRKEETENTCKTPCNDSLEDAQLKRANIGDSNCNCDQSRSSLTSPNNSCCQKIKSIFRSLLTKYGVILSSTVTQIVVASFTIFLLAISIYGNIQLKQVFDPYMFLPEDSSVTTWMKLRKSAFPSKGELVTIFFEGPPDNGNGNFKNMIFSKFEWLVHELESQEDIVTKVDFWFAKYMDYYQQNFQDVTHNKSELLDPNFNVDNETLVQFLFSQSGIKYKYFIDFKEQLKCGGSLPHIKIHMMQFTHVVIDDSPEGIAAMRRIKSIIKRANFNHRVFPFSPLYSVWEIDEIIRGELYRNLGLATIAIYFTSLVLLSDVKGSLYCLLSVVLTLSNVSGIMYFWGLTVDTATSTVLIICIGISVDFAAHVVYSFMNTGPREDPDKTSNGNTNMENENEQDQMNKRKHMKSLYITKEEKSCRMRRSLTAIAPAILHGGLSTLLAVILLAFSEVYVFISFFKIIVLVVVFGLYNGLVVLPVLLANFGPSYKVSKKGNQLSNKMPNQIELLTSNEDHELEKAPI